MSSSLESLESLEEKFRKVEQANERRILGEPGLLHMELVSPSSEPRRHHQTPGVSVSQFGKQEGRGNDRLHSLASSPLFAAASKSTFYHALANPKSVDSFVSTSVEEGTRHAEEQHEIQVERIVGRQALPKTLPKTVGALLPRRLPRMQSQLGYVSISRSTVVDVSVESTTESSCRSRNLQTSTAYSTRPSRPRAATLDIPMSNGRLVGRAKEFARKLRRRSKEEHQDPGEAV